VIKWFQEAPIVVQQEACQQFPFTRSAHLVSPSKSNLAQTRLTKTKTRGRQRRKISCIIYIMNNVDPLYHFMCVRNSGSINDHWNRTQEGDHKRAHVPWKINIME